MADQRFLHFLAVAEEASFGRAAARIGIRQPPLSQSIKRLECDLGVTLFERSGKGAVLTAAGRAFLPEARVAVEAAERAVALARTAVQPRAPVRIGVISASLWETLPRLLEIADAAHIQVEFRQATTNEQLGLLARGELDLGLVAPPFAIPPRLKVTDIARDPLVVAVNETLVKRKVAIALASIADRLVVCPRREGPVVYDGMLAMLRAGGLTPKVVQEAPRMMTTLALVAANRGAAFGPAALARCVSVRGVPFRPLKAGHVVPAWPLALAH